MDQDEALKLTYHFSSMRGSSLFIFLKIKYHGGNLNPACLFVNGKDRIKIYNL